MRNVHRGVFYVDIEPARLHYGVLLGVHGIAYFMVSAAGDIEFAPQALPLFFTTAHAAGSAVISRGDDSLVFDNHTAYLPVFLITT